MKKVFSVLLAGVMTAAVLAGCGGSKAESTGGSAGGGNYKDGTYKAKYDRNDVRDWKAFVEITVKGGKVTDAHYDYTNDKGEIRSDNKGYEEGFKKANKVTPKEVFSELSKRLVKSQDAAKVDTYTGATHSTKNFKDLAAAALENAKKGETKEAIVPLYKDGKYKVEFDNFDSHGWKAQVELEVKDHNIASVKYDYVNKDGQLKSKDAKYKEQMNAKNGTYPEKYIAELQDQLLKKQIIARVDAVSGATDSSKNFKALVEYALDDMAEKGDTAPKKIPLPKE